MVHFHVRVDRVLQGPSGSARPADPKRVDSSDLLWIDVEYDLPAGAAPKGEAANLSGPNHERFAVSGDNAGPGVYRFRVDPSTLAPANRYRFRFADDLMRPTYEDQIEVQTA